MAISLCSKVPSGLQEVEGFPVTVVNDIRGGDLYAEGKARYRVTAG